MEKELYDEIEPMNMVMMWNGIGFEGIDLGRESWLVDEEGDWQAFYTGKACLEVGDENVNASDSSVSLSWSSSSSSFSSYFCDSFYSPAVGMSLCVVDGVIRVVDRPHMRIEVLKWQQRKQKSRETKSEPPLRERWKEREEEKEGEEENQEMGRPSNPSSSDADAEVRLYDPEVVSGSPCEMFV